MGVVTKVRFSDSAKNLNFRLDFRYLIYSQSKLSFKSKPFSNYILSINNGKDISPNNYEDYNASDIIYPTVNNFKRGEFNYDDVTFINNEFHFSKFLENDDIIISRSGTVGLTYVWNKKKVNAIFKRDVEAIPSGYLIVVKIDKNRALPAFIKLLFNSFSYKRYFNVFGVGKSQKNIAQPDILSIPIPTIDIEKQKAILAKIKPIETEISNLKNSKLKPIDIINKVFGEEFEFDWEKFENLKKQKTYSSNLNEFANNIDCRMGLRFHNLAGKYLHSFLVSKTAKKVKDFIAEPIVLGKSVSPSDYDENGEFYYIAMSNIKTYAFDPEDCKKVSEDYSNNNLKKTVQKGDILLARSGEGTIGKVALIEDEDLNAIFADFTQRIRLTNYNTLFAYYYFRSEFFQYLVYTHKKGLGNNTNIFPSQIQEFPIPNWNNTKQIAIVEKIKTQIDTQNIIDSQIEQKQKQINGIIESSIKTE